jgi:uncharacterized membrane protein
MADPKASKETVGKNRVEALTDGIFAFALTVLVLNIEVPSVLPTPLPADPVMSLLYGQIPDFAHYFFAFVVLAGFWVSHHLFFSRMKALDRTMTWLNLSGLVFVALIPFSAQLADTYVDYTLAAIIFETNVLVIGIIFYIQWMYATKKDGLLDEGTDKDDISLASKRMLVMPAISVSAIALASLGITWTTVLYLLSPLALLMLSKRR